MSEEQQGQEPNQRPPPSQRPRREDGGFMSNKEYDDWIKSNKLEKAEAKQKESMEHLKDSNKALMRGTRFTEEHFKGMSPLAINKFLTNFHAKEPDAPAPNTPIIGTPIGSGTQKHAIDNYITIDPKERRIDFEAPGSVVFATHPNKNEARKQWWEAP